MKEEVKAGVDLCHNLEYTINKIEEYKDYLSKEDIIIYLTKIFSIIYYNNYLYLIYYNYIIYR